jgi:hypothetical protein
MNMPNFLIIGAEKAGTTALYHILHEHPQIYMSPVKEPSFFAFEGQTMDFSGPGDGWINHNAVTNLTDYQALFSGCNEAVAVGEASTYYLMLGAQSAESMARHVPDMKIIAILRHPVDRAYSAFTAMISYGREPLRDFEQALATEDQRWQSHWEPAWRYFENGCYTPRLQSYLDHLSKHQIKIYLYEDWDQKPQEVLHDICNFLDIDAARIPGQPNRLNISCVPRNDTLFRLLSQPNPLKSMGKFLIPQKLRRYLKRTLIARNWTAPPPLDRRIRSDLIRRYRHDIMHLQDILHRDLQSWIDG